ncbi:MAG: gluconate 2-dehydrogenase subunit 3 family protein [Bryobacteraceae bacterium]
MDSSRRDWIFRSLGSLAWGSIAAAQEHAHQAVLEPNTVAFDFFDAHDAGEIAAIAGQIIPSDDGPGAKEAGAIHFIDRALTTFDTDKQQVYRNGLREVEDARKRLFPQSESIASLSNEQQIEFVRSMEKSEFFDVVRTHTVLGFLGNPNYEGNRAKVGWKYIGFEDRMAFEPPFGYYDREAQ